MPEMSWNRLQEIRHQATVEALSTAKSRAYPKINPKLFLEEEKPRRRIRKTKPMPTPVQMVKLELSKDNGNVVSKGLKTYRDTVIKKRLFEEKSMDEARLLENEISILNTIIASIEKQL